MNRRSGTAHHKQDTGLFNDPKYKSTDANYNIDGNKSVHFRGQDIDPNPMVGNNPNSVKENYISNL